MFRTGKISDLTRKGVKKMKKLIILGLAVSMMFAVPVSGNAESKTATTSVSATVAAGTNTITVTPAPWGFGSLPGGTATTYRFSSGRDSGTWTAPGALSVTYFPAAPYEIRTYTDHVVGSGATDSRGYLLNGTHKLYLKVWCTNFGPAGMSETTGPDPMDPYFWGGYDFNGNGNKTDIITSGSALSEATLGFDINGDGDATDTITPAATRVSATQFPVPEEPCWLWMLEKDTMQEGNDGVKEFTRRRLGYNYPTDAELGSPFKVHLAMDVRGVAAGAYSGTVTFEMYTY